MKRRIPYYLAVAFAVGLLCTAYNIYQAWKSDQPVVDNRTLRERLPVEVNAVEPADKGLVETKLLDPRDEVNEAPVSVQPMVPPPPCKGLIPVETMPVAVATTGARTFTPEQERLFRNTQLHFSYLSKPEMVDPNSKQNRGTEQRLFDMVARRQADKDASQ